MHIPDGYLGPQTYLASYAVMVPFWAVASRKLARSLKSRQVPLLAMGAAFSFVIMMFNIPIPGGTTGHAVGAVLVALLLGPWAACVAVTTALVVQALMFGDGGITALGANCLTMAVVMPFTGWGVYRLICGTPDTPVGPDQTHGTPDTPVGPPCRPTGVSGVPSPSTQSQRRRWLAAAVAGYVGLNAGAIATALLFGLQPLLAHDAAGHPLYAPYPLTIALPVMAGEHLLVFGWVEAVVTGAVVAYLQRHAPRLLPQECRP